MTLSPALREAAERIRVGEASAALGALEGAEAASSAAGLQVRAVALAALGRFGEALRSARAALLLAPGYEPALELIDRLEELLAAGAGTGSMAALAQGSGALVAPTREWQTGEVIEGRWKIFGSAQGGMGRVYFVRDREWNGIEMAVKSLLLPGGTDAKEADERRRLFRRETQVWLDLGTHPHIVSGFYTLELQGELRFFMEYVPGRSLERVLRGGDTGLSLPEALDYAIQLAAGMEYVHARGVVHRDLKPSNCLVDAEGVLRVMDFGLGKSTGEGEGGAAAAGAEVFGLSMMGAGTPHYMAPEQWRSLGDAGKPADVYAFGVTLYELLSGLRPFDVGASYAEFYGGRLPDVLRRLLEGPSPMPLAVLHLYHTQVEPMPLREVAPALPAVVEQLALRCLRKDPAERPSFSEIRRTLLGLYRPAVGAAYGREISDAPEPAEAGESNRAVSYYVMGEPAKAVAILDAWLAHDAAALSPWLNRETIAVNQGEVEPAALWDGFQEVLARNGAAVAGDAELAGFQARMGRFVLPHPAPVTALAFHPDGSRLLAACADGAARLFDLAGTAAPLELPGHEGGVTCAALSADGALAATGSTGVFARVWDAATGALLLRIAGHGRRVTALAFHGELLATAGDDRVVRLHEARTGRRLWSAAEAASPVNALAFSADGRYLLAACGDTEARGAGALEIHDAAGGKLLRTTKTPAALLSLAFARDGRFFVASGAESTVRVFSGQNGLPQRTLEGHRGDVVAVAVSPDGSRVATAGKDRTARLVETSGWTLERSVEGHSGPLTAVAFHPDGTRLATASGGSDRTARLWSVVPAPPEPAWPPVIRRAYSAGERIEQARAREELLARLERYDRAALDEVRAMRAFTADYQRDQELVGTVHRIGLTGGVRAGVRDAWCSLVLPAGTAVTSVAFTPDGRSFATAGWDGFANAWDTASGRHLARLEGHRREVTALAATADLLVTASADAVCRVFDRRTATLVRELAGHEGEITALAVAPGGRRLLTGSRDRTVRRWEVETGASSRLAADAPVAAVSAGPGGRGTLTAEAEGAVLRGEAGEPLLRFEGHGSRVGALALSPDGRLLATGSRDRTAALWDTASGRRVATLEGHAREVICAAFSPDGALLLTGSRDGSARVWDARTGAFLTRLSGHDDEVTGIAVSASGRLVLTGSGDRTVRLFVLDSEWLFLEELLADAEAQVEGSARHARWSALRAADEMEGWLDLWQDLERAGGRPGISPEAHGRLAALRARLLELIAYLAWERGRALPADPGEALRHPLFRAWLADPRTLFPALAARLGVDAAEAGEAFSAGG